MALLWLWDNLLDARCDEAIFRQCTEHLFTQSTAEADATSCLPMIRTDANVIVECTRRWKRSLLGLMNKHDAKLDGKTENFGTKFSLCKGSFICCYATQQALYWGSRIIFKLCFTWCQTIQKNRFGKWLTSADHKTPELWKEYVGVANL